MRAGRGGLGCLGGKDPRRARADCAHPLPLPGRGQPVSAPRAGGTRLSPAAGEVLAFLKAEGACFLADLEEGIELPADELSAALVELVMAGLVTNDTLQALRGVLAWSVDRGQPRAQADQLAGGRADRLAHRTRRTGAGPWAGDRPSRARTTGRQAGGGPPDGATPAPPRWPGRWSLVHRIGVWGKEVAPEERLARQARQLLQCYGIVTRESLGAGVGGGASDWGPLYAQFQLMEMRGEVRRGYFVRACPASSSPCPKRWNACASGRGPMLRRCRGPGPRRSGAAQRLRSGQPLWPLRFAPNGGKRRCGSSRRVGGAGRACDP